MIDIANGRYWDLPWSLVSGCTPCSPGCDHCWSATLTHRFSKIFVDGSLTTGDGKFNGSIFIHPERLSIPLKRRKPTVFAIWNDLFHEVVPDHFRHDTYNEMLNYNRKFFLHTYLILSKRPHVMVTDKWTMRMPKNDPSFWFGLTICNQQEADDKIPVFLEVPGKKFLSIEPMLGPIILEDYSPVLGKPYLNRDYLRESIDPFSFKICKDRIDAVILGGETGLGARPMHPDWVRSVRDQCAAAGVPFFFKGWGEWEIASNENGHVGSAMPEDGKKYRWIGKSGKTFFPSAPAHEDCWAMAKVGRKKAGRLLDGRTHDDLPWSLNNDRVMVRDI